MCTEVSANVSLPTKMCMRPYTCYDMCVCDSLQHCQHLAWMLTLTIGLTDKPRTRPEVLCMSSARIYICTYTSVHVVTHIKHITQEYTQGLCSAQLNLKCGVMPYVCTH